MNDIFLVVWNVFVSANLGQKRWHTCGSMAYGVVYASNEVVGENNKGKKGIIRNSKMHLAKNEIC